LFCSTFLFDNKVVFFFKKKNKIMTLGMPLYVCMCVCGP